MLSLRRQRLKQLPRVLSSTIEAYSQPGRRSKEREAYCLYNQSEKDFSFTGYNHKHLQSARTLRKEMTQPEKKLWYQYCQKSRYKFYRQRPIDQFIVDFYCASANLVIELDGAPHYTIDGKQYDSIRTGVLERYHLRVIRFSNNQVMADFQSVCSIIDAEIAKATG